MTPTDEFGDLAYNGSGRRWILSLSGGGYRGLFTATILRELESAVGPLHLAFDLIAGTSIGSILAIGVAYGVETEKLVPVFTSDGTAIFPKQTLVRRLKSVATARYPSSALRSSLEGFFDKKGFESLKTKVVVPAVQLTTASHHVFRTTNGKEPQSTCTLVDAALASAAAPTYFEPHVIDGVLYADGGLIANKPDAVAAIEAISALGWQSDDLRMLCVGTTGALGGVPTTASKLSWGLAGWAWRGKLIEQMMAAQATLALESAQRLLPSNVASIDALQSSEQSKVVKLDRATKEATDTLVGLASTEWESFKRSSDGARVIDQLRRRVDATVQDRSKR